MPRVKSKWKWIKSKWDKVMSAIMNDRMNKTRREKKKNER